MLWQVRLSFLACLVWAKTLPIPERLSDDRKLLIFLPVGNSEEVMALMKSNVAHVRAQLDAVDFYLAHYLEGGMEHWKKSLGPWYDESISFSAERPGFKFKLMRSLLLESDFSLSRYQWVWALDDDIDITMVLLPRLLTVAKSTGALIVSPAFTQLGETPQERKLVYPHQRPADCLFRYTRMVEVIMPIFESKALKEVLSSCEHCIHDSTTWGLDRMWCSWTAKRFARPLLEGCAISDTTVALYKNYRSLKGKYSDRKINKEFMQRGRADSNDVEAHHLRDFVPYHSEEESKTWCEAKPSVPSLLVFILSRRGAFQRRQAIRGLWQEARQREGLSAYFAICQHGKNEEGIDAVAEEALLGDLFLMDCTEGYGRGALTQKVLATMRHFVTTSAEFFMKVDDDTFVSWSRLAPFLQRFGTERLYLGQLRRKAAIHDPCHPWYEPNTSVPAMEFMQGGTGYILGRELVEGFLREEIPASNMLFNEDRAVALWLHLLKERGIAADFVEVPAIDQWDPHAGVEGPSWKTWKAYPFFLHHHLQGPTIACLFLAEQTDDELSIKPCFASETPFGVTPKGFAHSKCQAESVVVSDVPFPEPALPSGSWRIVALTMALACASCFWKSEADGVDAQKVRSDGWDMVKAVCMVLVVWEHLAGFVFGIWAENASEWPAPQLLGLLMRLPMPTFAFVSGMFSAPYMQVSADGVSLVGRSMDASLRDLVLSQLTLPVFAFLFMWLSISWAELGFPDMTTCLHEALEASKKWYLWALFLWRLVAPQLSRLQYPIILAVLTAAFFTPSGNGDWVRIVFYWPFFVAGFVAGSLRERLEDVLCSKRARLSVAWGCVAVLLLSLLTTSCFQDTKLESMPTMGCLRWLANLCARGLLGFALMVACFAMPVRRGAQVGNRTLYAYCLHSLLYRNAALRLALTAAMSGLSESATVLLLLPVATAVVLFLCSDFVVHCTQHVVKPQWLLDFLMSTHNWEMPKLEGSLQVLVIVTCYMMAGPALMVLNKEILRTFPYPSLVSCLGMAMSAAVALAQRCSGHLDLQRTVTCRFWLLRLCPIGIFQAASLVFANAQYMYSGLTLVQILKSCTPVVVALVSWWMLARKPSFLASMALLALALGTWLAAGGGSGSLSVHGIFLATGSSLTEAIRLVMTEQLFSEERMSVSESLYYLSPPGIAAMLLVSLFLEAPKMHVTALPNGMVLLAAAVLGCAVNFLTAAVVSVTSATALKVLSQMRNMIPMFLGVVVYGEAMSVTQSFGYVLSVLAFGLYTVEQRQRQCQPSSLKEPQSNEVDGLLSCEGDEGFQSDDVANSNLSQAERAA